jgi:hypothetical protein
MSQTDGFSRMDTGETRPMADLLADSTLDTEPTRGGRNTEEVIKDHLERRRRGDLEGDLETNYSDDVILISHEGVKRGHDGVRELAEILSQYVDSDEYEIQQLTTEGSIGYIRWEGTVKSDSRPHDGTDSFVVVDGQIVAQTIHYGLAKP